MLQAELGLLFRGLSVAYKRTVLGLTGKALLTASVCRGDTGERPTFTGRAQVNLKQVQLKFLRWKMSGKTLKSYSWS